MLTFWRAFWLACLACAISGCSHAPARVQQVGLDPKGLANGQMNRYDTNKDGNISGEELNAAGGLKSALKRFDTSGDGAISHDEIVARVNKWREAKTAVMGMGCRVSFNGRPLSGATVKFIPEEGMGSDLPPAEGTTDDSGALAIECNDPTLAARRLHGARVGLYRVEISKKSGDKELIPARYNTKSILGTEIAIDMGVNVPSVNFDLKSE